MELSAFFIGAHGKVDPSHDKQNSVYMLNGKTFSRKLCYPRNFNTKPLSAAEQNVRTWFATAQAAVTQILSDPDERAAQLALYKANPGKYHSLRTWLFAKEYAKVKSGN